MMRFANKSAIVTGGASGIGLEIAHQIAREGGQVAIVDLGASVEDAADQVRAAGAEALAVRADVTDERQVIDLVARVAERWGSVDVVINSAGIATKGLVHQLDLETWNRVLDVNLTGTFLVSREAARAMLKNSTKGAIVNLASVDAHAAERSELAYNVSKAGVLALTRTFAVELGSVGIRVNSVSPGYVLTPMTLAGAASDPDVEALLRGDAFDRVPLRRGLQPAEIAQACCFLASDAAGGVTGQDLIVDGGLLADAYLVSAMRSAVGRPDNQKPSL